MPRLTTPKRTEASIAKLGGDRTQHQFQGRTLPTATHRITQTVQDTPPPDHLSHEVKQMWLGWVASAEWLAPSDLPSLAFLCDLMERRRELRDDPRNPHSSFVSLENLILRTMNSLGLTPQARIQLGLAAVEAESKLELFLTGGHGAQQPQATGTDDE